jgi:hypothetical protein
MVLFLSFRCCDWLSNLFTRGTKVEVALALWAADEKAMRINQPVES